MRPSVAELRPAAQAWVGWATTKPFIRRLWIFGSRARGQGRPDSDLNVAVEIDPVGTDENAYTSFVHDAGNWRAELQPLLTYNLHLKWYDQSNQPVWNGVNSDGIPVYERNR
jgi:predicted nucleotidyltransferase